MDLIPVHPSTNIEDAAFMAFRQGRHLKTVDGRVYMASGRKTDQVLRAFKARDLFAFAAEVRASQ